MKIQLGHEAIREIIRVRGAEISSKTCVKKPNQPSIFATSRRISQPHELGLIHGLLRCNRVAEPVVLNTIKPIFDHFDFLAYRGARVIFLVKTHTQNPFSSDFDPISGLYTYKSIDFQPNSNS